MQRLYRVVSLTYFFTSPVSAAISIIVLFIATLRLWLALLTRDDLANDNGQNRPLARGMEDAGRPLVR